VIRATLAMALREIRRNTLRSVLTMLGIVIGVGAVIALTTIGEGASAQVKADISKLGDNLLIVTPGGQRRMGGAAPPAPMFTRDDARAIRQEVTGAERVAATATRQVQIVAGNRNARTQATGTTPSYVEIRSYKLESGRVFSEAEGLAGRSLCVLGKTVAKNLFGSSDPIGQSIRLDKVSCDVTGVLAEKGQSGMGQDQDDLVILPLRVVQRRLAGNDDVNAIYVSARDAQSTTRVRTRIESLLRERRKLGAGSDDDRCSARSPP
jgi:putative ABC transport system permease protein